VTDCSPPKRKPKGKSMDCIDTVVEYCRLIFKLTGVLNGEETQKPYMQQRKKKKRKRKKKKKKKQIF
jgi:hypothetical protein